MNSSTIFSDAIAKAVRCAVDDGNEIDEISEGWEKVRQVIHMKNPITESSRDKIERLQLRYWSTQPTPHNKAEEGFTDDTEKVAITFPR